MPTPPSICHLTSAHKANDVRIFQKECRSLARAGYRVSLVVPCDRSQVQEGVSVRSVPVASGRLSRMTLTVWRIFREALRVDADLYHFHDPELLPVGLLLKLLRKKVVYDAHENLPEDILVKKYLHPAVRRVLSALARGIEALAGAALDGIVTVVPVIAARFPDEKTIVLANVPLLEKRPQGSRAERAPGAPVTLAYTGGLSDYRGILEMIRSVEIVNQRHPARLLMAGSFNRSDYEEKARQEPGWRFVDFRGQVSSQAALDVLYEAQIGLLLFQPSPHNLESSPNKLFEYMLCDLPIVMSDFPFWRSNLEGCPCGLFVDPTDPSAVAEAICWLVDHPAEAEAMGKAGNRTVNEAFNWEQESRKLLALYGQILGGPIAGECHA